MGGTPFLTGSAPSTTLAGPSASSTAFSSSSSWDPINMGTPSLGVSIHGSGLDAWGNPAAGDFGGGGGGASAGPGGAAGGGGGGGAVDTSADDDWDQFLNL